MPANKSNNKWVASDTRAAKYLGMIEFKTNNNEFKYFEILQLPNKIVFGGSTNNTFLESGNITREDGESLDETLQQLLADLETYYNDGPSYTSRICVNERM